MTEILWCNRPIRAGDLEKQCAIPRNQVTGADCGMRPATLLPYRPYLVGARPTRQDQAILAQMRPRHVSRTVADLSFAYGGDNTHALAAVGAKLSSYGSALSGAATDVYQNRIQGLLKEMDAYQTALLEYRGTKRAGATARAMAYLKARNAFDKMNRDFGFELNIINRQLRARRGTPLSSFERGINIARDSRRITRLDITSQAQATNLVNFTRYAKFLGNGITAIDLGSRAGDVYNSYEGGGDWHRELFIESTSFVTSTGAGYITALAGDATLAFLVTATPVGWVGLAVIVGGLALTSVAAAASMVANQLTQDHAGSIYDEVMEWLGSK